MEASKLAYSKIRLEKTEVECGLASVQVTVADAISCQQNGEELQSYRNWCQATLDCLKCKLLLPTKFNSYLISLCIIQ
jgi:hypothetical protein